MNYISEFTKEDSEYIYQQIEEIKAYVSSDAGFLLEEIEENRITLKIKDGDKLFLVDSTAFSIIAAVKQAKDTIIQLILDKVESQVVVLNSTEIPFFH